MEIRPAEADDCDTERAHRAEIVEQAEEKKAARPACPVCGGQLADIRRKLCCVRCHSIIETCCD
jgi:hypothetical protein